MSKLTDLMVDTKTVWVPFEGMEPFEVELSYISRTEMSSLVEDCQKSRMDRATRGIVKELDQEKFIKKFTDRAIKNWKGLTVEKATKFLPLDVTEENKNAELLFDKESAAKLLKESQMFDDWVNEKITDIDTFRS